MPIDVLETLNRRFAGLFALGSGHRELRPRDILTHIVAEMERARRQGLDGGIYVPNVYTLQVAIGSDDERQYLRTFFGAEELATAVAQEIETRGYGVKGMLVFTVEEVAPAVLAERIRVICRFDPNATAEDIASADRGTEARVEGTNNSSVNGRANHLPYAISREAGDFLPDADDEEPGTVMAVGTQAVATLIVLASDGTLRQTVPVTLKGVRIGRSRREGNDVVIEGDPMVSKRHARLAYEQGRFMLYDEGSTNGTFLRNNRLAQQTPVPLNFEDEFRVGDTRLRLRSAEGGNREPGGGSADDFLRNSPREHPARTRVPTNSGWRDLNTPTPDPRPLAPAGQADDFLRNSPEVVYRLIAGDGEVFPLASAMTVGRAPTEDIVLLGNGVSSRHARLSRRGVALYVEDLNTAGGTFVNGERIPAHFPVALHDNDQLAFGEVLLRVERR